MNHQYKNHAHHISLRLAISGLLYSFKTQPNFLIMALFSVAALILSFTLNLSLTEKTIVVWTIIIVFIAEMINTSIESITDLVTQEWHEEAKIAKDVSSGMVLMAVIGGAVVGLMVFLPKLMPIFR